MQVGWDVILVMYVLIMCFMQMICPWNISILKNNYVHWSWSNLENKWYLITFYFYDARFAGVTVASCKFMQMKIFDKQSVIIWIWVQHNHNHNHISGEVQILKTNSRRLCEITLTLSSSICIYMFCIYMSWL